MGELRKYDTDEADGQMIESGETDKFESLIEQSDHISMATEVKGVPCTVGDLVDLVDNDDIVAHIAMSKRVLGKPVGAQIIVDSFAALDEVLDTTSYHAIDNHGHRTDTPEENGTFELYFHFD